MLTMAQTTDSKSYYGYLFQPDKKPSPTLDALLRGIADYIVCCTTGVLPAITNGGQVESIGSKEEKHLTPTKLAAFYKAVGGNYDCATLHHITQMTSKH